MRASTKEYAEMGGHDVVANIVEEAWGHQSYYSDPSMVKWTKEADGSWEFDYTWYDAWINFMIECGVIDPQAGIGQIKCYSIVPWSNQITYYDEAQGKTVSERHNPGEAYLGGNVETVPAGLHGALQRKRMVRNHLHFNG